jgi:lipopolysaccharide transport system permease protein
MAEGTEVLPERTAEAGGRVFHISASQGARVDLPELWRYRELAWLLAWRNIRVRYKQTFLGLIWAVLTPVSFTLIFLLLFRLVPLRAAGDLPYLPATFAAMGLWQLFSRGLTDAGTSLTGNANLITKVYFPRLVLPLASVLSGLLDFVIVLALLAVIMIWYGAMPSWHIVALPAFVLATVVLTVACSLWFSAIDALFRDLRHALPLLLQLGMFASPVAYTTAAVVPERWRWLYELNPMVMCLEGLRWSLFPEAPAPTAAMLAKGIIVTAIVFVSGSAFFARIERTIVDRV